MPVGPTLESGDNSDETSAETEDFEGRALPDLALGTRMRPEPSRFVEIISGELGSMLYISLCLYIKIEICLCVYIYIYIE